jgi:hypothetical protein
MMSTALNNDATYKALMLLCTLKCEFKEVSRVVLFHHTSDVLAAVYVV